ncbi:MAG: hypothetical protein ABFS12_09580 [Bacteroidota bacterium]
MHINKKIVRVVLFSIIIAFFASCAEKEEVEYVAKVGKYYLTEEDVSQAVSSSQVDSSFYREVFIRRWIEEQLLYLAAEEKGILSSKKYQSIVRNSEKKAANTLLIKEVLSAAEVFSDTASVTRYFNEYPSEFKLTQPAIVYNFASFNNFEEAENFRKSLFYSNWNDAVIISSKLYQSGEKIFLYIVQDSHDNYKEVYKSLYGNQVSNVMVTANGLYIVFQLLERFDKNEIPDLKSIYDLVKERYAAKQREEAYKNYIKELYSNYNTRIER